MTTTKVSENICGRYGVLIGKKFKTRMGMEYKVLGMITSTAFGALFIVEYAGGFKMGTMCPKTVEENACQIPLKNMTQKEVNIELRRFHRQWKGI